jgi:hypothetical protein
VTRATRAARDAEHDLRVHAMYAKHEAEKRGRNAARDPTARRCPACHDRRPVLTRPPTSFYNGSPNV